MTMPQPHPLVRILLLPSLVALLSACGSDDVDSSGLSSFPGAESSVDGSASVDPDATSSLPSSAADATSSTLSSSAEPFPLPERPWSIREQGPFNIGFRSILGVTFVPRGSDTERTIALRVWYPTTAVDGLGVRYAHPPNSDRGFLRRRNPALFLNAPLAREADERMPLLVFSHGNSGIAEQNYSLTEYFASHGWVVVAPDHTDNTFFDNVGAINLGSGFVRPQDISATLDHVLDELPAEDPLYQRIDPEAIVVAGHSFGGFTSLAVTGAAFAVDELVAVCEDPAQRSRFCDLVDDEATLDVFREGFLDERVRVSIPMTPGGHDAFRGGESAIRTPTLVMTGARDATLPNASEGDPIWDSMRGAQHIRLDFAEAGHFTFSNMCDLFGPVVENDGCEDDFMDVEEAYFVINTFSMAFARFHLLGDDSERALLDGEDLLHPDIVYSRRDGER